MYGRGISARCPAYLQNICNRTRLVWRDACNQFVQRQFQDAVARSREPTYIVASLSSVPRSTVPISRETSEVWLHWMASNHSCHVLCPCGQHRWVIKLVDDKLRGRRATKTGKFLFVLSEIGPDTRDGPNKECWHANAKGYGMCQDSIRCPGFEQFNEMSLFSST